MLRAHTPSAFLPGLLACTVAAPVALLAQSPVQTTIQLTATVTTAPPAITFTWPLEPTATAYAVYRRLPGTAQWGPASVPPGGAAATTWTDATVALGARYEYFFSRGGTVQGRTFLTAGVEAVPLENRGKLVLLVDATKAPALGARLDRLIEDLTGDGWTVLRHDVLPTATVPSVKALITADVAANPGQVKSIFLLGRIPVPYSGALNPDGHPDHFGAWPADVYYGELNGTWTDTSINTVVASRLENRNVPGDGKFDQTALPSDVDVAVGRVDLSNMPSFGVSETVLLERYLDKDHDYRHKVFAVDQRAVIDDNFGYFGGEAFAASGWRNFAPLVGPANITAADYFTTLNTTSGNGYSWSYGCGGGSYQSAGGIGSTIDFVNSQNRSVFTMLFGSYFGDWDVADNFLRAPLCTGWTLTNMWAGRPHSSFHPMGPLGETVGAGARLSQNDTGAGGYGTRWVHIALMGDPTLRQHIIAPPSGVAVADLWPQANISWNPSPDLVAGYHVYRATSPQGPFTRLTTAPVAGTIFTDPTPIAGDSTYLVRALRLETTPTGTYWNLSQGAFATQRLPQQAAAHTTFGAGCYAISDSLYQYFATPALASAALSGQSITFTPAAGGYTVSSGGGTFVPPSGTATVLALGDDDQLPIALSAPFAYPGGSTSTLHVHSNGIVAAAALAMSAASSAVPSASTFLNEAAPAWYCWHDFDPSEAGSGDVAVEELSGTVYVTWNGVESHPAGANGSTLQFQFELATGVVRQVWSSLTAVGTGQANAPSEQFLVGWSPGGASVDAGPLDLATALPQTVGNANVAALQLSASPAPVITPVLGATVTYTIDHAPELSPGSYVGFTIVSFAPDLTGTSLATMGMPGCAQHLGSLDLFLLAFGTTPTLQTSLVLPAGIAGGTVLYAQALALMTPNSLPNGQNAFGAVTSNGIASFLNDH